MNIEDVINQNRARLRQARELNIRAGRRVFPVPGPNQLSDFFYANLDGARRVGEVSDFGKLLLPELDGSLVAQIFAECPSTIVVLGQSVKVDYEDEYGGTRVNPRVKLSPEMTASLAWRNLPDEGFSLPNGRRVVVAMSPKWDEWIADTDIKVLKSKARECLNKGLWDRWKQPEIPAPTDTISPVMEREYGRCVVTGESLIAYGTVRRTWSSWYSYWTRDRNEATRANDDARRQFAELKMEMKREALKKQIAELYRQHRVLLPARLHDRMYNIAYYMRSPETVSDMEAIIAEVEELLKPKKTESGILNIDVSKLFGGNVSKKK